MKRALCIVAALLCCLTLTAQAQGDAPPSREALDALAGQVHERSLEVRRQALERTIAQDEAWPGGRKGDMLWTLSALYLNQRVDEANARLRARCQEYFDWRAQVQEVPAFLPEHQDTYLTPWAYFQISDFIRSYMLFSAGSDHLPGRLEPETEAMMRRALWLWVREHSVLEEASLDHLWHLCGTENHDLTKRPNYYFVSLILAADPEYRDRPYNDGHTAAEHASAYTAYFREWPRQRAMHGMWVELGSDVYQKYSWPHLMNLHDLAPDPVIRERFGMLLDLAFIEEAQSCIHGRRGGGRSRAGQGRYGRNAFEGYKDLFYAPPGVQPGASHSRVFETSLYQLPPAAIALRYGMIAIDEPFVIQNRVLGEMMQNTNEVAGGENDNWLAFDSALVNYIYRTPTYMLGCTLQDPSLSVPDAQGRPTVAYAGISRQDRWCGMLLQSDAVDTICAVYPFIETTGSGRPQHPYWSVQHENVLILQRIAPMGSGRPIRMGSYNTGMISIAFTGEGLELSEQDGWIFAQYNNAYLAVRFLDGGYTWNEDRTLASPTPFNNQSNQRILMHAGDTDSHGSFAQFQQSVRACELSANDLRVTYRFNDGQDTLQAWSYRPEDFEAFRLPQINGQPIDVRPATTYASPYLNAEFASDQVHVTVGPYVQTLDFSHPHPRD